VIQINPDERKKLPESIKDILDRRNELAGNISLNQEIDFIKKVNKWTKYLPPEKYKPVKVEKLKCATRILIRHLNLIAVLHS